MPRVRANLALPDRAMASKFRHLVKRVMVRMPDDLYARVNGTAHYSLQSMNAWIVDLLDDRAYSDAVLRARAEREWVSDARD